MSPPSVTADTLRTILHGFTDSNTTISAVFLALLDSNTPAAQNAIEDVTNSISTILSSLCKNAHTRNTTVIAIHCLAKAMYMDELKAVAKKEAGLHFNARCATEEDLLGFDLVEVADKVNRLAPNVCDLVDSLLNADSDIARRRRNRRRRRRRHAKRKDRGPIGTAVHAESEGVRNAPNAMQVDGIETPRSTPPDMAAVIGTDEDDDDGLWAALPYQELPPEASLPTALGGRGEDIEMDGPDDDTPPDEDEEYWDSLEPLPEDPDDPESLTDPYKEEARYDAILKMVSGMTK